MMPNLHFYKIRLFYNYYDLMVEKKLLLIILKYVKSESIILPGCWKAYMIIFNWA